jgi:hypothetical protein
VDDVFQELDGLRADVATLMSTADDSNFMQIVDIVENLTETQKELISFRKAFTTTNFCCDTTVYSPPTEPDDTTAPQASHCQRVQWLRDQIGGFIADIAKYEYEGVVSKLNKETIGSLYQARFEIALDPLALVLLAGSIQDVLNEWGMDTLYNNFIAIESTSFSEGYWGSTISVQKGFLCAIYDATNAQEANDAWKNSVDAYFTDDGQFAIYELYGLNIVGAMRSVLLDIPDAPVLNALFAGTIPSDTNDLTGYDNLVCAGCISPGGGDCPLTPGESVDIPSGGTFFINRYWRETIIWPTSGSWANIPRDEGYYGAPPGGNIKTDCVAGWEISFPFDQLSNDTFRFVYRRENLSWDEHDTSGTVGWTIPSNIVELMVYRSGSGHPWDRPFTLRVTRPL